MKLQCKIRREWGEKVFVANQLFTIDPNNGTVDVPDDAAAALLQNKNKWEDPANPHKQPALKKRAPAEDGLPNFTLKDAFGNELTPEETAKVLAEQEAPSEPTSAPVSAEEAPAAPESAPDPLAAQVGEETAKAVDDEIQKAADASDEKADMDPEEAPDEYPEVSMKMTKADLEDVCARLEGEGWELDRGEGTKKELLEAIQAAYDVMD